MTKDCLCLTAKVVSYTNIKNARRVRLPRIEILLGSYNEGW